MTHYEPNNPKVIRKIDNKEMDRIRKSFLSKQLALYRPFLPRKVLRILDKMLQDISFPGATDCSALSLLSIMVKLHQPAKILQLGTYIGFSSLVFAGSIATNDNSGKLYTVEPQKVCHEKARYYAKRAGVAKLIEFIDGFSTDPDVIQELRNYGPYNLIYIDSSHAYKETLQELKIYVEDDKFTDASTLVLLHDAGTEMRVLDGANGGVPRAIEEWINHGDNKIRFQLFIFEPPVYPNPCGLAMIRKVK